MTLEINSDLIFSAKLKKEFGPHFLKLSWGGVIFELCCFLFFFVHFVMII